MSNGSRSRSLDTGLGVNWSIGEDGQSFIMALGIRIEGRYKDLNGAER